MKEDIIPIMLTCFNQEKFGSVNNNLENQRIVFNWHIYKTIPVTMGFGKEKADT